jgi:hypothetical protein
MVRSLSGLLAVAALLIAVPAFAQPELEVDPRGPGALFASIEAAAVDGLAWSHELQRAARNQRLSRGGTVFAVDGGYTYGELVVAHPATPDKLELKLGKSAVAHFHTYPSQGRRVDRTNESHSRADRWVVDRIDSKQRPSYILTPSLRVVAYHGRGKLRTADVFVASLSQPLDDQMIAAH